MKNIKKNLVMTCCALMAVTSFAFADASKKTVTERAGETVSETYQDTKDGVKKTYRKVEDKTCEMINGKMECVAKKVANKTKNAADEVKDKANDVKKN